MHATRDPGPAPVPPDRLGIASAGRSTAGRIRRGNEDALLVLPQIGLWAVADGMGGHDAGAFASDTIVDELAGTPAPGSFNHLVESVETRIHAANAALREEAMRRGDGIIVGSTVVALMIHNGYAAVLWAGDSRLYLRRDDDLYMITRDHTLIEAMIGRGELDRGEARAHPAGHVLTRAVGSEDPLRLDRAIVAIQAGDRFLLCSDGLTKCLDEADLVEPLGHRPDIANDRLHALALSRGATDDVTSIVVAVGAASAAAADGTARP